MNLDSSLGYCSILVDFENLFFSLQTYRPDLNTSQELVNVLDKLRYKIREDHQLIPILNRAYADYQKNYEIAEAQGDLQLAGFEPQFIRAKPNKNSADILLSIDAMELTVCRADIRCIIICAGDSDYLPIIRRILEYGKQVLLCGFSFNMSGDLKRQVGEANIIHLNSLLPPNQAMQLPTHLAGRESDFGEEVDWDDDLNEHEDLMTRLIMGEYHKHEREVWVGPFLRDSVPAQSAFEHFSRFEVQEIIEGLKVKGVICVRKIPGKPHPYSVFSLNFKHPFVRRVMTNSAT